MHQRVKLHKMKPVSQRVSAGLEMALSINCAHILTKYSHINYLKSGISQLASYLYSLFWTQWVALFDNNEYHLKYDY